MIYILWTSLHLEEARRIIRALLEQHLVACASIWPVESMYHWKGALEESHEVKVLFKTQAQRFDAVVALILEQGSYEIPEIAQWSAEGVNPSYAHWVAECTDFVG